jgi:hypothetical protein
MAEFRRGDVTDPLAQTLPHGEATALNESLEGVEVPAQEVPVEEGPTSQEGTPEEAEEGFEEELEADPDVADELEGGGEEEDFVPRGDDEEFLLAPGSAFGGTLPRSRIDVAEVASWLPWLIDAARAPDAHPNLRALLREIARGLL